MFPQWRPLFRFVGQGLSSYFSSSGSRHGGSSFHRSGDHTHAKKNARSSAASAPAPVSSHTKGPSYHVQNVSVPASSQSPPSQWNRYAKRNESNASDDSIERMLQGRVQSTGTGALDDVEMGNLRSSDDSIYGNKVEASAGGVEKPHSVFPAYR